jgi:hypothetical protein
MNLAPLARVILRYPIGAGIFGSSVVGESLAADPDLVFQVSVFLVFVVEGAYAIAKRKGWAT